WSGIEGFSQDWEHRDDRHDSAAGLLGLDPAHTFVDVLATVAHGVATAKTAVEQNVKPHSLTGADGPTLLILCDVLLGPRDEAVARLPWRITDPDCGIALHELRLGGPLKQPAHGIKEVASLGGCTGAAISTGDDSRGVDLGERLVARCFDDVTEDVLALLPGCSSHPRPSRR